MGEKDLSLLRNVQTDFVSHATFHSVGTGVLVWKSKGRGVNLTTHFHLTSRLRMDGVTPLLPKQNFTAWTGKTSVTFVRVYIQSKLYHNLLTNV